MPSRSGSVFSDNISTTSSQWTTTYKHLPKKQPTAVRFMSWAAGAPRGATVVKKRTRDTPDDRSVHSAWSSSSYWGEPDTQLYWVTSPQDRYYYSGSSSSGRSSRSSRSGGRKSSSSRQKHFNGAVPPPMMMHPPPGPEFDHPMDGHYVPPPPGDMGGHFGGGGFGPPPPPPMNAAPPPGGQPAFFDVTGQHQPGNPFHGGGPPHGFPPHGGMDDDGWESGSCSTDSYQ